MTVLAFKVEHKLALDKAHIRVGYGLGFKVGQTSG